MMDRRKQDALNQERFQQFERQIKQLENQKERNAQQLKRLEQAEMIFTDLQIKEQNQLETLSQNWKGERARSILSDELSNLNHFQRQQQRDLHEKKRALVQNNRQIAQQEEKLNQMKRQVVRGGR